MTKEYISPLIEKLLSEVATLKVLQQEYILTLFLINQDIQFFQVQNFIMKINISNLPQKFQIMPSI